MAKKNKSFLPKRIAGVKVPKAVRKGRFGELLASPTGQALLAQAVLAAGAAVGAKKVSDSPKARDALLDAADRLKGAGGKATDKAGDAGSVLAYALGEAARSFADALHRPGPGAHDEGTEPLKGLDGEDSKKKPTSYEAGPL